jgi:hypothetical protein
LPKATIVKLDPEGAEFIMLPDQIGEMPQVYTWIVKSHPSKTRKQGNLISLFGKRCLQLYWINRHKAVVEPYPHGIIWNGPATIFTIPK